MRDVLSDILRQTTSLFECIKVTAEQGETILEATDKETVIFLQARLKTPVPEFIGQFGMNNLSLLNGLLNFPSYNTEDSKFKVVHGQSGGKDVVTQFVFEDAHGGVADYRLMMPNLIPDQAEIRTITWTGEVEPNKSRLNEFDKLQSLFGGGMMFTPKVVKGDLHFVLGDEDSNEHSASMLFEPGLDVPVTSGIKFPTKTLMSALKLAGANPVKIHFSSVGVIKVAVETNFGIYDYLIRGSR